jgi:transposase
MPKKVYVVTLSDEERHHISELTRKGTLAARKLARAHILRLADEGKPDAEIVSALGVGLSTVERTRRKYVEGGLDEALSERPRPRVSRKLSEKGEAYLIALSCSTPPDDQVKWTMQLLSDRLVAVGIVDEISDETVRRTLKKMCSNHGKSSTGASLR